MFNMKCVLRQMNPSFMTCLRQNLSISTSRTFSTRTFSKISSRSFSTSSSRPVISHFGNVSSSGPLCRCGSDRYFSTTPSTDETSKGFLDTAKNARAKLKQGIKEYGLRLFLFETVSYGLTAGVFFVLFSNGLQMTDVLIFTERFIDLDHWTSLVGVDKSVLTGNASKLVLSLAMAEIVSPLKLPLDLAVFYYFVRIGWIGKPKPKMPIIKKPQSKGPIPKKLKSKKAYKTIVRK